MYEFLLNRKKQLHRSLKIDDYKRILSIFVIHRTAKNISTFVTDILNICPVMSMFLLVGQLACNFLAMSFQTISPSLSGTWSHLLQTKMAHSGSNCCNNPFCSNSSCFLNIFTSWNYTKQTKLLSRILEMFMHIPCCVEIRSVVGLIIITDFFEKWMRLTFHNFFLFVILQ